MIQDYIETYGRDVHIMIEAKHKELALLEYRNKYLNSKQLLAG